MYVIDANLALIVNISTNITIEHSASNILSVLGMCVVNATRRDITPAIHRMGPNEFFAFVRYASKISNPPIFV